MNTKKEKKEDESISTQSIKGYKIEVEGQYYSMDTRNSVKSIKPFPRQTFYFPETITYRQGNTFRTFQKEGKTVETPDMIPNVKRGNSKKLSLHIIRRFHLEPKLRESVDDFINIRTCRIFSIKEVMVNYEDFLKKDIDDMTEAELNQFVAVRDLNVYLTMYGDLVSQKEAVKQAHQQKVKEFSKKKKIVTEETNIYQTELDSIEEGPVMDSLEELYS